MKSTTPIRISRWLRPPLPPCIVSSSARSGLDRKSTRLNSSHVRISYAVFCLKKKNHPLPAPDAPPSLSIVPVVMDARQRPHRALRVQHPHLRHPRLPHQALSPDEERHPSGEA